MLRDYPTITCSEAARKFGAPEGTVSCALFLARHLSPADFDAFLRGELSIDRARERARECLRDGRRSAKPGSLSGEAGAVRTAAGRRLRTEKEMPGLGPEHLQAGKEVFQAEKGFPSGETGAVEEEFRTEREALVRELERLRKEKEQLEEEVRRLSAQRNLLDMDLRRRRPAFELLAKLRKLMLALEKEEAEVAHLAACSDLSGHYLEAQRWLALLERYKRHVETALRGPVVDLDGGHPVA
ncbi:hypothetical protein [Ammonifex thiophilus]|uniref:Uncharacterized protein n=1 Tax=Ammonifex thiophilus TaxID=444093 RepID=A0A3D8P3N5_9THEO|nr:hypothetical protein [Ammonifex thiophilus]RDV81794.1 hypothetical protein DXX99_08820 [Ammonifex thiophilus]